MNRTCNTKCAICKGFTLVELLVVIAIIALLMSILMPALGRARRQAQGVICLQRLHSWGVSFQMFADDHDGYFPKSQTGNAQDYWIVAMLPYIGGERDMDSGTRELFFCPSATIIKNLGFSDNNIGTTFSAWGRFAPSDWADRGAAGSYGFNDWCANPTGAVYWTMPSRYSYRTPNVSGGNRVPVILDALYADGYPLSANIPPPFPDMSDSWDINAMQFFCTDRHQGGLHGVFMDWSARKIGLKELWRLKWHKGFDLAYPAPDWESEAPWMRKYKDY